MKLSRPYAAPADHREALANHHDAGNDAYLHWLIGGELAKRAKARGA